ncbi:MAG: hypothetical protein Q4F73_01765, partial [Corynebacterium sp.]|nr:hypothetical protein [Corynebacterium sp.]
MESNEARQALGQVSGDAEVLRRGPAPVTAVLLAALYGGVLLMAGWQLWWWMAGMMVAFWILAWVLRDRIMDTVTRGRGGAMSWHLSQLFPMWLPLIPLVSRGPAWFAVLVAVAGALHAG